MIYVSVFVLLVVSVKLVSRYIVGWYHLEEEAWSMLPTLRPDDFLLTWRWGYRLRRGDLIVFEHRGVLLVKRAIGLPGDVIELTLLGLFVNHVRLDEPYAPDAAAVLEKQCVTVPPGQYYILGDARANSFDSRHFCPPCIPRAWIRGKVWRRIRLPGKPHAEPAIFQTRPSVDGDADV
jgi:signal peptidase I